MEQQEKEWLLEDVKFSRSTLDDKDCIDDNAPVFFDEFHLSPLKIHISFSPEVNIDTSQVFDLETYILKVFLFEILRLIL